MEIKNLFGYFFSSWIRDKYDFNSDFSAGVQ
jgi:hypothetical protein